MQWRHFRRATEHSTVLIGWSDREFSFKIKRRTDRSPEFSEPSAVGESATRRRSGRINMGRCPMGSRLELSRFELASAHLDFAHAGRATLRKKSRWASFH